MVDATVSCRCHTLQRIRHRGRRRRDDRVDGADSRRPCLSPTIFQRNLSRCGTGERTETHDPERNRLLNDCFDPFSNAGPRRQKPAWRNALDAGASASGWQITVVFVHRAIDGATKAHLTADARNLPRVTRPDRRYGLNRADKQSKIKGGHPSVPPLPLSLSTQTQPLNQLAIPVYILSGQIRQMAAPLAYQLQQTPA